MDNNTMLRQICLAGQPVDCHIKRSRRKTVGMKISHEGLQVNVPNEISDIEIDTLVQSKTAWILNKLAIWKNKTPLTCTSIVHSDNAVYPLLGQLWGPEIDAFGRIQMVRTHANATVQPDYSLSSESIRKWIVAWYQQQAITCFSERITVYASKLNVPKPPFKLSQARTRWGSCNSRGVIRLNQRLIQLPLYLIDYVVAHELCHLIEMNHSRAFWVLVSSIYPDYQKAFRELKGYSL